MAQGSDDSRAVRRRAGGTLGTLRAVAGNPRRQAIPQHAHLSVNAATRLCQNPKTAWVDRAKAMIDRSQNGSTGSDKMAHRWLLLTITSRACPSSCWQR